MRRVLVAVVLLVVLLVAGVFSIPWFQAQRLGRQLAVDAKALQTRVVTRSPAPTQPLHDNGFACLAGMLKVTPRDLSPFEKPDVLVWATGEKPLDTLPKDVDERMRALMNWSDELRACGSSMKLQPVEGLWPWDVPSRHGTAVMTLSRLTALETTRLLADNQAEMAFSRCNATLAMTLDQSQLGLLGAMEAVATLRTLAPRCAQAFHALSPEGKKQLGGQWVGLATRLASNREVLETERVVSALTLFSSVSPEGDLPRPSDLAPPPEGVLATPAMRLLWSRWDAAMRAYLDAVDDPATRAGADAAFLARVDAWWVPAHWAGTNTYGAYVKRLDEGRLILSVLQWLAAGASGPLPPGATRVDGAVEWTDSDGKPQRIPVP